MDWVIGCDLETRNKWIMWLYGGAGAGKSAIGQTFVEKCDKEERLLASFFFGLSDATRNNAKFLIPTIACQVYERVPEARNKILSVINNDPLIFSKTLLIQLEALVIKPLIQLEHTVTHNLIIIDGLDECLDKSSQTAILGALFDVVHRYNSRIRFLVASRPEHDIGTAFSLQNNTILTKLVLDDEYQSYLDIELFLRDKIQGIKETHPFRHLIPQEWPRNDVVDEIVNKSSGQFIYISAVVRYIESNRHRPEHRLDTARNLRPPQGTMPFAELDALYTHILTSVEDILTVVELLSFLLHASQLDEDVTVASLEEIHDLEPGSLKIILCDLGALVVLDKNDKIKVMHASLLDFFLDPLRSKVLPIVRDSLITKHITHCLRFLSKNKISDRTTFNIRNTRYTIIFLKNYLDRIPVFTVDMAEAFDGFSLLELCQEDALSVYDKHNFLKWVHPIILELLRRSSQQQLLSRYLAMMDESYLTLMDQYTPQALALQISIMMHGDVFPRCSLDLGFQLAEYFESDDKLGILCFSDDSLDLGPTEANRSILQEFLVYPARSKHQSSDSRRYTMALLGCFSYLNNIIIQEDCFIDETLSNKHASFVTLSKETALENTSEHEGGMVLKKDDIQARYSIPETDWDEAIPSRSEEHVIVDTEKDIKAWQQDWHDELELDESMRRAAALYDLVSQKRHYGNSAQYYKITRGRYYLMLGYIIYFFPLAGASQKLIKRCKTTVLRRDSRLFPQHTASAQRAMAAYLRRMAETVENNENNNFQQSDTIPPALSAAYNTPLEDVAHNDSGSPDNLPEKLDKTLPTVGEVPSNTASLPTLSTSTTVAPVLAVSYSMSRIPIAHVNTPPDKSTNDAGTQVKKSKKKFVSQWWRARKRT